MKAFLNHFAAILGALTVALLTMSVSHEYGYFTLIGRHFQTLLTTTDYLANSVLWLPWAMFFVLVADWKLLEQSADWSKRTTWLLASLVAVGFAGVITVTPWPPSPISFVSFIGLIIIVWSWLWPLLYKQIESFGDELNAIYDTLFRIGPPLLALVFLFGWVSADIDADRTSDPYLVKFKGQDHAELRIFLRSFDRGPLMRNAISKRIEFHRWDDILTLEKQQGGPKESLMCYVSGYGCQAGAPAIP